MQLLNPQTFAYSHPNFGGAKAKLSLNHSDTDNSTVPLDYETPDGAKGGGQVEFQDNGTSVFRIHRDENNPMHVRVVGPGGVILFED